MATQPKPVDLICVSAYKHDGQHIAVGEIVLGVEAELAKELTAAGRTRLATDEDKAAVAAAAKAAAKAPKAAAPAEA